MDDKEETFRCPNCRKRIKKKNIRQQLKIGLKEEEPQE